MSDLIAVLPPVDNDAAVPAYYPIMPADAAYAACYCEENVYLLAARLLAEANNATAGSTHAGSPDGWSVYAVFISNRSKSVALWAQRAARTPGTSVVWDYHVVLALRPTRRALRLEDEGKREQETPATITTMIYDADCTLGAPCSWKDYVHATFSPALGLPPEYHSLFRVIPAEVFLAEFASDRSHMLRTPGGADYLTPPPAWAPLRGHAVNPDVRTNLMDGFVAMDAESDSYGMVYDLAGFVSWCAGDNEMT